MLEADNCKEFVLKTRESGKVWALRDEIALAACNSNVTLGLVVPFWSDKELAAGCRVGEWVEYEGTSVVQKVWDGKANLGELEVEGPAGRIEGLSLRTYNPETGQWHIHWASSSDGTVGPPMVGGFEDGRGEFYNQEFLNGRAIYVRFIFSDLVPDSFRIEQAFSADGGKTWETNWIATFERVSDHPDEV